MRGYLGKERLEGTLGSPVQEKREGWTGDTSYTQSISNGPAYSSVRGVLVMSQRPGFTW